MMTTAPVPDSQTYFRAVLRGARRRLRAAEVLAATLLTASAVGAELLAIVLADHAVDGGLSWRWRAAGLVLMATTAAIGLALGILRPAIRRLNDLYVVRSIERAHPEFRNDLTAAIQLADDRRLHRGVVSALAAQAARELADSDAVGAAGWRRLRRSAASAATIALLLGLYALLAPKPVWPSLRRALGADAPAPAAAALGELTPRDGATFGLDQSIEFAAELIRGPAPVTLELRRAGQDRWLAERRFEMIPDPDDPGRWLRRIPAATLGGGVHQWRLRCGDATAGPRTLTVVDSAALHDVRLTVIEPDYVGAGERPVAGTTVAALAGARLRIEARAPNALRAATVRPDRGPAVRMQVAADRATALVTVERDDRFELTCVDVHGQEGAAATSYRIELLTDQPPTLHRAHPAGESVEAPAGGELRLAGLAEDDFGLAGVSVRFAPAEPDGAEPRTVELLAAEAPGPRSRTIDLSLPVDRLGAVGDEVLLWFHAADHRPPGGQRTLGQPLRVRIVEAPPAAGSAGGAGQGQGGAETNAEGPAGQAGQAGQDGAGQAGQDQGAPADEGADAAGGPAAGAAGQGPGEQLERDRQRLDRLIERMGQDPDPAGAGAQGSSDTPQPSDGQGDQPGQAGEQPGGAGPGQTPPAGADEVEPTDPQGAPTAAPPGRDWLESAGRAVDEAARRMQRDEIDPELLAELDMSAQQFRDFVQRYDQVFEQLRPRNQPGAGQRVVWDDAEAPPAVFGGAGRSGEVDGADVEGDQASAAEGPRTEVAPEYRQLVEDYFRSVGAAEAEGEDE